MAWRTDIPSSSRLSWTLIYLVFGGMLASAQSSNTIGHPLAAGSKFIVAPSIALSANATSEAVADLNGDGKPDLVVTSANSGNVTVFLGNGNGGFGAGTNYPAGKQPGNVLVADINGLPSPLKSPDATEERAPEPTLIAGTAWKCPLPSPSNMVT